MRPSARSSRSCAVEGGIGIVRVRVVAVARRPLAVACRLRLIHIVVADDGHEIDRETESASSSTSRRSRDKVPTPPARGG
jgi:hypothetical protein